MLASIVRSRDAAWLWLAPALILLFAMYLFPLARVLGISVLEPHPGLENYGELIASPAIRRVFVTTLRIAILTTVISVTMGYIVAYAMVQATGWRLRAIVLCVMVPFWISVLVRGFAWMVLLRATGVINTFLMALHLISDPLDLLYNEFAVLIGMVHCMVPIAALTLYGQMAGIDRRLMAAARGLGAGRFLAFRRVFLPLSAPGIAASSILIFIGSLGFYIIPALLGGGKTLMLAEYVSVLVTTTVNWGLGTAMASSLILVTLLLILASSRITDLRRALGGA